MFLSDLLLDYFANMVIVLSQNGRGINARMHTHTQTHIPTLLQASIKRVYKVSFNRSKLIFIPPISTKKHISYFLTTLISFHSK